ncbi:MAG: dephospho-CoA kinase [Erysipelotrichia bacterium]|nr:dephospho-CoA kinase [Erysipelotrichia bacterium]
MQTVSKAIKIGLTGSIASGKSTALSVFKQRGFAIFSADDCVSSMYHDALFVNTVKQSYPHVVTLDSIDKSLLVKALSDPVFYEGYIHLVHDHVLKNMIAFQNKHESQPNVCEIPLLFEAGWERYFDQVWCIVINDELSFKRALERGMSASTYHFLKEKQWSIEEKSAKSHVLVHNESTKEVFIKTLRQKIKEHLL